MRINNNLEIHSDMQHILDKLIIELRARGSKLLSKGYKDSNDYFTVQCLYHKMGQENHPSAQFRKSDGLFYCHGCKTVRSLDSVIYDCLGVSGRSWLLENFSGTNIETTKIKFNLSNKKQKPNYVNKDILKRFRKIHPYMYERKLNLDTIRKFDVGYNEEANCITFPNRDEFGNILFIATRNINNKFFSYPSGVDKPIYGLYEIYREIKKGEQVTEVYICESMLDCLSIWSWGKYAIALNGTGSNHQYELIKKCSIVKFILATDNDEAGKRARVLFRKNVTNKFIRELDYSCYGDCKDINDMTKEQFLSANIV